MYTVVDEGYDIDVFRTLKEVSEAMAREKLYFDDIDDDDADDAQPATAQQIAKVLRKDKNLRLVEKAGDRDWKFRIEKQSFR